MRYKSANSSGLIWSFSPTLKADGEKQAAITAAEGEKESAILRADAVKQQRILEAEGEAQAMKVNTYRTPSL